MMWSAKRVLFLIGLSVTLAACQSTPDVIPPPPPLDPLAVGIQQLEDNLVDGRLSEAERQLNQLEATDTDDARIDGLRQRLSEAYLQQGRKALQQGDINTATTALSRARALMKAPALTTGLDGALEHARHAQEAQQEAEQARQEAEKAAAEAVEQVQDAATTP